MISNDSDPVGETNEMPPFFSIITITLNNSIGLQRTWLSLFSQSESDWEWIVVDGGSVDETPKFLAINKNSIAWWVSERDDGIYDAMNKGCAHSKGNYILFLNAGDLLGKVTVLEQLKREIAEKSIKVKNHNRLILHQRSMGTARELTGKYNTLEKPWAFQWSLRLHQSAFPRLG